MALTQTGLGCGGAAASYQSCRAAQLQSVVLFHTLFAQMAERGIEWLKLSRREHPLPSSLYLTRGGLIYEHVHKGAPLGGGNYKKVCRLASLIPGVKEMVQAPYDATALARLGPRYLTEFIQILQRLKRALAEEEEDVPLLVPSIMVYFSRKSWEMKVCQFMPRMEEDLFEARCRFSFDQKVVIAKAVARALAFMHRNGVAHLDVKLGNILVEQMHPPKIRLADLDFVLFVKRESLLPPRGSPQYADPNLVRQQLRGMEGAVAADQFSWGHVLYILLTDEMLPRSAVERCEGKAVDYVTLDGERFPDLDPSLQDLLLAVLLRREPKNGNHRLEMVDERPKTMDEVVALLE